MGMMTNDEVRDVYEVDSRPAVRSTAALKLDEALGLDKTAELAVPPAESEEENDGDMEYQEWVELKPQHFDKEFFDTNSGNWMIASYEGLQAR